MDSPKILLGYTKPSLDTDTDAITVENIPEIKKAVYLSLHITIEPLSEMHITTMSHLECSELRELKVSNALVFKELILYSFIYIAGVHSGGMHRSQGEFP